MLTVETVGRVRREGLRQGKGIRAIARDLRLSRDTVRKILRSDETAFDYERVVQPMPKLGAWLGDLDRLLSENEKKARRERLTLVRIYEALSGLGYAGGYDAVRRYAKVWRKAQGKATAEAFVPLPRQRLVAVTTMAPVEELRDRLCRCRWQ